MAVKDKLKDIKNQEIKKVFRLEVLLLKRERGTLKKGRGMVPSVGSCASMNVRRRDGEIERLRD